MSTHSDSIPGFFRRRQAEPAETPPEQADPEQTDTGATTGGGTTQEPVVVWEAANNLEAQIVKGRLESEGIPAIIRGEAIGSIYGLTTGSLAATDVLVPAPLAEKAIDILSKPVEWDEDAFDEPAFDDVDDAGDAASHNDSELE
ncbi:MAG: DUF2007 domain-containing protein [Caldilineaceae bacterium]|nr:DUF2007 domain-containing protein [Caldilineaceae bacterium]